MKKPYLHILICLQLFTISVLGQFSWRVYSPSDKSFSIELPAPLRKVMSFEGEHGANLNRDQKIKWASCYAAIETTPEDSRFGIIVVETKYRRKFNPSLSREKWFVALSNTFLPDDDEAQYLGLPTEIKQKGLTGKEYFYVKEATANSSSLFTRGRIFDVDDKFYILVFVGKDSKNLDSSDAKNFLDSFRVIKHTKN